MKIKIYIQMGIRNIWKHRKQHLFLYSALALCFSIISLMTFLSEGMSHNVYDASRIHYGGDVIITAFDKSSRQYNVVDHWNLLDRIIQRIPENQNIQIVKRSSLFKEGYIFFNGQSQLMKNITGIDIAAEMPYLEHFDYQEGSAEDALQAKSVIISSGVADLLNIKLGDNITLKISTRRGQINTGDFIVRAIVNENTILGYYRLFMNRREMNELIGFEPEQYSMMGLYLNDREKAGINSHQLYMLIKSLLPTGGEILSRDEYSREMNRYWRGIRYFVFPLSLYISEVDDLLRAMDLVSFFLYFLMLCITLVSVLVTYSIIIHNRRKEFAVFSTLGLKNNEIQILLLIEAAILLILSIITGFVLSLITLFVLKYASFEWIPGFGIFLKKGHLTGSLNLFRLFLDIGVIFVGVIPVVWLQIWKKTSLSISDRLSGGEH